MHNQRSYVSHLILLVLVVALAKPVGAQTLKVVEAKDIPAAEKLPPCVSYGAAGYKPKKCSIRLDRQAPVTPASYILQRDTTVVVEVFHARPNEQLAFVIANTKSNPPDPFAGAVKAFGGPLGSLVLFQSVGRAIAARDETDKAQDQLAQELNGIQTDVNHANTSIACLGKFQFTQDDFTCSQAKPLKIAEYPAQKQKAKELMQKAATENLPIQEYNTLDSGIGAVYAACVSDAQKLPNEEQADAKSECQSASSRHLTNEARIKATIASIQTAQAALLVSFNALDNLDEQPASQAYQFVTSPFVTSVVAISGQDIVLKTPATPIVTATINAQAIPWVLSGGIGFSNLKSFTYTNAPIIINGVPSVDSGGKTLTQVTSTSTSPSIITPLALVSYRLNALSRARWEMSCRGSCAFLLSGGIGANLTSKSADFDTGVSFQIGSVMFTPSVHFGRESRLTNGVFVGERLGSSPPTLATQGFWVRKFGFSITYVIPTPVTGQ
jgi:hypothetical protein